VTPDLPSSKSKAEVARRPTAPSKGRDEESDDAEGSFVRSFARAAVSVALESVAVEK